MALIEFKDLPDTSTPITAENLNEIQKSNICSTSEIEVGKWIDNKPIYRKCFQVASMADFETGITADTITKMECLVKQTGLNHWRNLPWLFVYDDAAPMGSWAGGFFFSDGRIAFQVAVFADG